MQAITTLQGRRHAAVCLDVDGTLYRLGAGFALQALRVPAAARALLRLRQARNGLRGQVYPDGEALRSALRAELARRGGLSEDQALALLEDTAPMLWTRLLPGRATPGLRAALESLRRAGVRLAAFSDDNARAKLVALGVAGCFDAIVSAEDQGAYKPHPAGFLAVQEALGMPPAAILHAGDRADTDIEGARSVGWDAVLVGSEHPVAVRWQVRDVAELAARVLAAPG